MSTPGDGPCVGGKDQLCRKIGNGSFREIYLGMNPKNGEEVGIKLENAETKHPQLLYESKLYKFLAGGIGIPNVRWFGVEGGYHIMVMVRGSAAPCPVRRGLTILLPRTAPPRRTCSDRAWKTCSTNATAAFL